MTARELLAAVRAAQGLPSNYALARFLDVRENNVGRWHSGRNTPDDATAARLAELAGLDPDAVVAAMHAQRADSAPERERWSRIAERLTQASLAVILSLWIGGGPDGGALLGNGAYAATVHNDATVYTLCTVGLLGFVLSFRGRRWGWRRPGFRPADFGPILCA